MNQLSIDLHSHSIASDGTLTPTELVQRAHAQGVNVLALTDHPAGWKRPVERQRNLVYNWCLELKSPLAGTG